MVLLEITEGEGGFLSTYYLKDTAGAAGFVAGYIKKFEDGRKFLAIVKSRPIPTRREDKKLDYEISVYKKLIDNVPEDISRIEFLVSNLPTPNMHYTEMKYIKERARAYERHPHYHYSDERYYLRISELIPITPPKQKSLFKTEARKKVQKENRAKEKHAREMEKMKYRGAYLPF